MLEEKYIEIWKNIKEKYAIREDFYPQHNIYDTPGGGPAEIKSICNILEKNGYEPSLESVYYSMELKRQLFYKLQHEDGLRKKISDISEGKVGTGFGAEEIITNFLLIILLNIVSKLGEDIYQKAKEITKKIVSNKEEQKVLAEITISIYKDTDIQITLSKINENRNKKP